MPVQGQPRSVYCASTFLSTTPQWPGPQCELLKVAVIMVIMMMMTVMVMSISRLDSGRSPGTGFKTTALCRARHSPLLWHHVTLGADSLPFFSVFLCADSLLPQCFREPFTVDSLSDSASLHHAHTLASVLFPLLTTLCALPLYLSVCLSSVYLSTLLHLYPSPLSHSFPVILVLLTHGVIAQSRASIFMTISAYASRFLLACVIVAELGRGRQIRPWGVEKITSRL